MPNPLISPHIGLSDERVALLEESVSDEAFRYLADHGRLDNGKTFQENWTEIQRESRANVPGIRFAAAHQNVMRGAQCVARACSKTMAKRIANALNNHVPNREGV